MLKKEIWSFADVAHVNIYPDASYREASYAQFSNSLTSKSSSDRLNG